MNLNKSETGYLVLGDIHNNFKSLMDAYLYAKEKNLVIVQVGDLVDYGPLPQPTIHLAHFLVKTGKMICIEGNHDNKIYRWTKGNNVKIVWCMEDTINAISNNEIIRDEFLYIYENMVDYVQINDTFITHGGFSKEFWQGDTTSSKVKKAMLYGEVDNNAPLIEYNNQSYPHRKYDWAEFIPSNITVIVGHDRSPFQVKPAFDKNIESVFSYTNTNGGVVHFTDTGSGKGGFVSGIVLTSTGSVKEIVSFNDTIL